MVPSIRGLLVGDKGYLSAPLQHELRQVGIELETALRSKMHDSSPSLGRLTQTIATID